MDTKTPKTGKIVNKLNLNELPIDEWKEKHKRVKHIAVKDLKGDTHEFVIGRPTMPVMDMITKYLNENKSNKYRESMKNNCVLAGDLNLIETDIDVQNAVFEKISELFEKLETTEKEL